MSIRALYDTNVLVTILTRRELVLELKRLILDNKIVHVTSSYILDEAERVLAQKMDTTRQKARVSVRLVARISEVIEPGEIARVSRDPFDDAVLAAAIEGRADYIVTADQDLLVLRKHRGVGIIAPDDFAKLVEKII